MLAILESGCVYQPVRATPHLQHGVSTLYLSRVENHSGVVGIEGPIRRHLETRFLDYLGASSNKHLPCLDFGSLISFHGMNQKLFFVHTREAQEQRVICQKKDYPIAVVVRLLQVEVQPVAFIKGTATGPSLGLQKDALLASTYQVSASLEIELQEPIIPGVAGATSQILSTTHYSYTSTYSASTFDSDLTGASRNYLRNQLALVDNMESVGQAIAENVYNTLTSIF